MANPVGRRSATIAVAIIASLAAVPASSAAMKGAYEPPIVLPGDASAAAVKADPHNWLVSARAGTEARAVAKRFGAQSIGSREIGAFVIAREKARALAAALKARGLLVSAYPNALRYRSQAAPTPDPLTPSQWWRNAVVNPATPTPPPAPTAKLGLVDSMPDMTHPEWAGSNFSTLSALPVETEIGHGTATAAVAAAPVNGTGIIGIWPGMFAVNSALPPQISCADSVAGIGNVLNAGATVVNMSYGSLSFCPQEYAQLQLAVARGVIPVASAGNELAEGNPPEFPASLPHVLTVAAITEAGTPAAFSNSNAAVDVGGPGTNILSAVPVAADHDGTPDGYTGLNGTSFSSPIVAAATTWVRAARPTLTPDQVAQVIRLSANDVAPPGWDPSAGFGMVNIDKALIQQPPPPDPLEPNDDIVWIDGRAFGKKDPAVFGGRRTVRFVALLDALEDPEDVYRIVLPGRRRVLVSVKPAFGDTDVAVYDKRATSVDQRSRILRRSGHAGAKTDAVTVRNRGRRSRSAYVRVFIHTRAKALNAAYVVTIRRR
jgi:Subtilase family